jgi:hypothetical protein
MQNSNLTKLIETKKTPKKDYKENCVLIGVMLHVIPMSLLCPSKNEVAFKITIELVIDQN